MLEAKPAIIAAVAAAPDSPASGQASGPRPNRDLDAIPDGRATEGTKPTISLNASVVSDYRLRGITQSAGHAAVQASIELVSPAGLYTGAWGSTIATYEGAHTELDFYGGYRTKATSVDLDIGIISYLYPGADGVSSAELYATGAQVIGDATIKFGISYTPRQSELGDGDGLYLFTEAEKPLPGLPLTVRGHIGRETGVDTITGSPKLDWLLGADTHVGPATISLAWVDARYRGRSSQDHHSGSVVAAVALDF
ncbi:TorF family putative porin [Sphingomonas sp. CFBP 13706]|uniref:TorF family putative porin n=1 Tax=Sphingomonas sp. CFBP 13706 TaxID=2775314 RepID=UPI00177FF09A|nr:TorF family putative porin [Sphingomonas sp. CFBP 13706]MBD8737779.1 hypothetical protein [Sphingomonas sp. CFBP 13706]